MSLVALHVMAVIKHHFVDRDRALLRMWSRDIRLSGKRIIMDEPGAGPDPRGGFRRGFAGTTTLTLKDFGIDYNLGPAARQVELFLSVEGIRK